MDAVVNQRKERDKAAKVSATASSDLQQKENQENGAAAGIPLFLQRQTVEEAEEALLQPQLLQAKLTVGAADDPLEKEADAVADHIMRQPSADTVSKFSDADPRVQRLCAECEETLQEGEVQSKREAAATPRINVDIQRSILSPGSGSSLPGSVRNQIEPVLGRDLSHVQIHIGDRARAATTSLKAKAFTHKNHIWLAAGQSAHDVGLMAHETTHVVQQSHAPVPAVQRNPDDTDEETEIRGIAELIEAVTERDISAAVAILRGRSISELCSLRCAVITATGVQLERWFNGYISSARALESATRWGGLVTLLAGGGASGALVPTARLARGERGITAEAEEGLRIILPALSLVDRLLLYDEGVREIEQAQLDTIRSASEAERLRAGTDPRMSGILAAMSPQEEYQARILLNPANRYAATAILLRRAPGTFSDEEDPIFNAIMALPHGDRRRFWDAHYMDLYALFSLSQYNMVRTLSTGTEAEALMARLRLATEGRIDDTEGIQKVVQQASRMVREWRQLQSRMDVGELASDDRRRLEQLGDMESLLDMTRTGGDLSETSFMGRLAAASGSPDQFGQWARSAEGGYGGEQLEEYRFQVARQRILMAAGTFSVDDEAIETAVLELQAPMDSAELAGLSSSERETRTRAANGTLRQRLLDDREVRAVIGSITGPGGGAIRNHLLELGRVSAFDELYRSQFVDAVNHYNWGEVFRLALVFSQREEWRRKFRAKASEPGVPSAYARISGTPREIVDSIVEHRQIPLVEVLRYTGNMDILRPTLGQIDEARRGRLRLGYWLSREEREAQSMTQGQSQALTEFQTFEHELRSSQTTAGIADYRDIQDVLDLVLGESPTSTEMATGPGRYRAATLMYSRARERLGLDQGMVSSFTETDETMIAAAREFMARYEEFTGRGSLSAIDFAMLTAMYDRFQGRSQEFAEAADAIGEIAGMVAATVAAVLVVAVTGGTATPGVIAAAAAAGGGSRLLAREMFGADYYNPASEGGARDVLLGALDGALAVVGSSLAARGVELMGLSGRAVIGGAARIGEEAVEQGARQAGQTLGRRVVVGSVEGAIDNTLAGTITEAVSAMTDARSWRRGVWQGLVNVGQAAIVGGFTGLATGSLMGGVMPVGGEAAGRMWRAIASDTVEDIVARAGPEAREILEATRTAVGRGEHDEARRLLGELEGELTPRHVAALRRELGLDGSLIRSSEGTAEAVGQRQREMLEESRLIADGRQLGQQQLDLEMDLVSRSSPRASTEPGYVDEVDLGNGHVWRRRENGTWCRFSGSRSLCGTVIHPAPTSRIRPRFQTDEPPLSYRVEPMTYDRLPRDQEGNVAPLPRNVVYEFPGGHRAWRDPGSGAIRHDSVLGPGSSRARFELELPVAGEHGAASVQGMHRAHTLGQGTGFESPFGIYYAPAEVNLLIQNNGIEEFMRGLSEALPSGRRAHVVTTTVPHPNTLRLKQIRYQVEIDVGGRREFLFEYVIDVGNNVPNPSVTHGVSWVTGNDQLARVFDDVDVPQRLRNSWARRGSRMRAAPVTAAENLDQVLPLVGQPVSTDVQLPAGYAQPHQRNGRWVIPRLDANNRLFEPLTVRRVNGVDVVDLLHPRSTD